MAFTGMVCFGIATAIQCGQWSLPLLKYESSSATSSGRPHTSSPSREPSCRGVIKTSRIIELRNLWTLILFKQSDILVRVGHHELQNDGLLSSSHARVKGFDQGSNFRHGGETRCNQLRKRREHCYCHFTPIAVRTATISLAAVWTCVRNAAPRGSSTLATFKTFVTSA